MATSAVAAGKVLLAAARGEQIPAGWIVDSDGKPTTDPTQLRKGGALLPLGGTEGYKGSGLAAMVEILCGLLTGLGFGVEPTGRHNDGCFMAVFKVEAFRPLERVQEGGGRVRPLPEGDAAVRGQLRACSIPARSSTCASRSAASPASTSRTRPGTSSQRSPREYRLAAELGPAVRAQR